MEKRIELTRALGKDIEEIMRILGEAREAQRRQGFVQWLDGYPRKESVEHDVAAGAGWLFKEDDKTAGYVAIYYHDDEYERLSNIWKLRGSYGVVHRVALSDEFRGRGLASCLFSLFEDKIREEGVDLIRVDTGVENRAMQHLMLSRGYENLGAHDFVWGERLAFEKAL